MKIYRKISCLRYSIFNSDQIRGYLRVEGEMEISEIGNLEKGVDWRDRDET